MVDLFAISAIGENLVLSVCFTECQSPFCKGSTLYRKNLFPESTLSESKFFPHRVDPFSEGNNKFDRVVFLESGPVPLNCSAFMKKKKKKKKRKINKQNKTN